MGYRYIVLAKQVPDTKKVTGEAMKEDGTVNRAALPAVFNPEDLHALETAIEARDRFGGEVILMTMGMPKAGDILREGLCRGADRAILVTDRRAAGSDTLATSYILSCAVKKVGDFDIVFCGRQAIDGDTAQVGTAGSPRSSASIRPPTSKRFDRALADRHGARFDGTSATVGKMRRTPAAPAGHRDLDDRQRASRPAGRATPHDDTNERWPRPTIAGPPHPKSQARRRRPRTTRKPSIARQLEGTWKISDLVCWSNGTWTTSMHRPEMVWACPARPPRSTAFKVDRPDQGRPVPTDRRRRRTAIRGMVRELIVDHTTGIRTTGLPTDVAAES